MRHETKGDRDLDLPAGQLQPIVYEAGSVHRLDRRPNRLAVMGETSGQAVQTVGIWRRRTDVDGSPTSLE